MINWSWCGWYGWYGPYGPLWSIMVDYGPLWSITPERMVRLTTVRSLQNCHDKSYLLTTSEYHHPQVIVSLLEESQPSRVRAALSRDGVEVSFSSKSQSSWSTWWFSGVRRPCEHAAAWDKKDPPPGDCWFWWWWLMIMILAIMIKMIIITQLLPGELWFWSW